MKKLFVAFCLIMLIFLSSGKLQAQCYVTKANSLVFLSLDNKNYLQFKTPDGKGVLEIAIKAEITLDDSAISIARLQTEVQKDEYAAWLYQSDEKIVKIILTKNCYQIRIKAIDPAGKRLLSCDGYWYFVLQDVALNRYVAGDKVNVYLSFDGQLERILPLDRELQSL